MEAVIEVQPSIYRNNVDKPPRTHLLLYTLGALFCGMGFSTLQERIYRIDGFVYGGWMSFLTYLSWIAFSFLEMAFQKASERHASFKSYAVVSIFSMSGVYLTNWSLLYLNYATRIVMKSGKVLPVMIFRKMILNKHYSLTDYCAAITLASGIYFYTIGDKEAYPQFSIAGLLLIAVALICDALTSNLEERWFFRISSPCPNTEVVRYISLFSCPFVFTALIITGELYPALLHSIKNPLVIFLICTFSFLGYIGVKFILLIVQHFGATKAEIIKSIRRVLQVSLSFLLYPKPVTMKHWLGGGLVFLSLSWFEFGYSKCRINK